MPNEYEIAAWRFDKIAPLLDSALNRAAKRRAMRKLTARPVEWPSGKRKRIPRSTARRWVQAFQERGYFGLMPKRRSDAGKPRRDIDEWIDYAIVRRGTESHRVDKPRK